jgi:hypothetical protein
MDSLGGSNARSINVDGVVSRLSKAASKLDEATEGLRE